jgi:hypothetical protein
MEGDGSRRLRHELSTFEERITSGGQFTFGGRQGSHDDYVALLITAMLAEMEGQLQGSALASKVDWDEFDRMGAGKANTLGVSGSAADL